MSNVKRFSVAFHFKGIGWDTYTVNAYGVGGARFTAARRVINECGQDTADRIDYIEIYDDHYNKVFETEV